MENYNQLEQDIDRLLPQEDVMLAESDDYYQSESALDLEPNIIDSEEEYGYENAENYFEDLDEDEPIILDESYEYESDFEDSFAEGRGREKANKKRSVANAKRISIVRKNIKRVHIGLVRNNKLDKRTRRDVYKYKKALRKVNRRSYLRYKKVNTNIVQLRKATKVLGQNAAKGNKMMEMMGLMVIPKLVGHVVSGQINEIELREVSTRDDSSGGVISTYEVVNQENDLLSSIAPVIPDIFTLIGQYVKTNKFVLVGIATLVAAAAGGGNILGGNRR